MQPSTYVLCPMLAIVAIWPVQAQDSPVISHSCIASIASIDQGCIQGSIAGEVGTPLKGIAVDILPADKVGDERWDQKKSTSTDSQGIYAVGHLVPGEYLIAVHYYSAPDGRHPFPTTFYPGVEVEGSAERVSVRQSSPVLVGQLKLRRLQLQKIKVDVLFADGSKPESSSLLLHNPKYPEQAVIGNESLAVAGGFGEFEVPAGFSYLARVAVQCESGSKIETRESRPVQEIKVESDAPIHLMLTIPGAACQLWRPK